MFGECLEAFTFTRTKNAVARIVEVFPYRCWRLQDGRETRVLTSELKVGDHVVVNYWKGEGKQNQSAQNGFHFFDSCTSELGAVTKLGLARSKQEESIH